MLVFYIALLITVSLISALIEFRFGFLVLGFFFLLPGGCVVRKKPRSGDPTKMSNTRIHEPRGRAR